MSTSTVKERYSKDEARIRAVIGAVEHAHLNKDAAAVVPQYASDAVLFTLAPPLAHHGMIREETQKWMDGWEGPIERQSRDLNVTVSGDHAMVHGYYRLSGSPKAAGKPISFWMRATVILHRDADAWRIVHEHTSVPFYMDGSLRPAFDLQPQ